MSSSMLSRERRWASARRGGMTVLGKVAVPKPINLPSQRLENLGLDPSVEIVPKGTHSWGSKSSSSSSNAWGGSSSLSPNTDGGSGSPSYPSGRPSSGGTGTRPSTAGSDRAHDPISNAWSSSSRPSSSSGVLTSNHTSQTTLRPRSAETRPGSSQLSRFAEPLSDNSVAWGGSGTSEKLGVTSSKKEGFSLTGDFPSLCSEKDRSGKNTDSQDHGSHGRPGSSSSGVASWKEHTGDSAGNVSVNVNANAGGPGSWRKESSMYGEDGARPNVEKWHGDPQPYPNSNIHHSQHFDSWHGPPVNNHPPGGVWYRGPPGGPPFGSPIAPGGFPMEPYPYYHPQIPPSSIANPQPVRPPNIGPIGAHLNNGDMYRPHMHDPYVRPGPGMPIRPGFYPGPVPYDNYYGPPMGYCNSNERDVPFMGMAMGPAAYNRYPGQNVPDPGNPLVRTSGHGPCSNPMGSEQVEAVHPQDTRGLYKVLLKQHESWEGRDDEQKWDGNAKTNYLHSLKEEPPRKSSWENGWRTDDRMDDEMDARRMTLDERTCEAVDNRAVPSKVKSPENATGWGSSDESSVKKFEHGTSNFAEVLAPKGSSLIQKIEGLNAKARACDVRQDVKSVSTREEQKKKVQVGNVIACHPTNEAGDAGFSHEKAGSGIINFAPPEDRLSVSDKSVESTGVGGTASARKSSHSRADHHGKMRFNTQEVDGWRKKTNALEAQTPASCVHSEISYGPENNFETTQNSLAHPLAKDDGEPMLHVSDVNESQVQRAKMKELAKRIKQREKEEEERTREQRAKALAKLEELNRRTQAGESVAQKVETGPSNVIQSRQESSTPAPLSGTESKAGAPSSSLGSDTNAVVHNKKLETVASSDVQNKEESSIAAAPTVVASKSVSDLALDSNPSMIAESSENSMNKVEKSASTLSNVSVETAKHAHKDCAVAQGQSKPSRQDGNVDNVGNNSSNARDGSTAKHKRPGYRQKHSIEKNSNDKSTPSSNTEASKGHSDIATNATTSSGNVADEVTLNFETNLPVNTSVTSESSAHHRKKSRSGKNRHKVEDAPSALPPKESKDTVESSGESVRPKTSETILVPSLVESMTSLNDANQSLELHSSLANEEGHTRLNNQWKSQHPRMTMRNQQGAKSSDKNHGTDAVVWAPVRSHNKVEVSDEVSQTALVEASLKSDQLVQNNPRNKRAEMERYVPKPVAKELSHQVSSHQAVPSNKVTSDEVVERHKSSAMAVESTHTFTTVSAKVGSTRESRNGEVKQNKPGKVHGSWPQRATAESTAHPRRNFQKSFEDNESQKIDESFIKEPRNFDEYVSDGWYMPYEIPDSAVYALKDQGLSARGKRHSHKGYKGMGYNHNPDEKRAVGADPAKIYTQSTAPEVRQTDSVSAKENHAVGERATSHWQPKTQPLLATDQRGSQSIRSVNVAVSEGGRTNKKESTHRGGSPLLPRLDRDTTSARSHQFLSEKTNFEEAPDVERYQGPKRERKTVGRRGRPISPVELSSHSDMDVRHDQHMSGGLCRNGNGNSRYGKEHESHGECSGSGKDNKQHNLPAAWERQNNNSYYKYQPVGPQNNKPNRFEHPKESPHNSGPRFRERGQSQPQRGGGNFSRRQTGGFQVDAGCE